MSNPRAQLPTIQVHVSIDVAARELLAKTGVDELEQELQGLLDDLVSDLGLADGMQLRIRRNRKLGRPFETQINAQLTRTSRQFRIDGTTTIRQLAVEIASDVFQNRGLLISIDYANAVRRQWAGDEGTLCLPGLSRSDFLSYLRALVGRCFSLDRGVCVGDIQESALDDWTVERCFEFATCCFDQLQVILHHPQSMTQRQSRREGEPLDNMLREMLDRLFYELGLRFPKVVLRQDDSLGENEVRLQVNDVRLPPVQGLAADQFIVNDTVDRLKLLGVDGMTARNPIDGSECAVITESGSDKETCEQAGLTTMGPNGYVVLVISSALRRLGGCFVNEATVKYDFDVLSEEVRSDHVVPDLIERVRSRFGVGMVTQVLRNLIDEGISYRNLRHVLQAMIGVRSTTDVDVSRKIFFAPYETLPHRSPTPTTLEAIGAAELTDTVRTHLKRQISHKHMRGGNTLVVYLLDRRLENRLYNVRDYPVSEEERVQIVEAVHREVGNLPPTAQNPVVLTTREARRAFHELIKIESPYLSVLCFDELSPDVNIQPIARIEVE